MNQDAAVRAASAPLLDFEEVGLTYGERVIFQGLSFQLEKGAFVYLTGKSGAGKTSLLRLIYADERPNVGLIRFQGEEIQNLKRDRIPYHRRKLGMVFQDFRLLADRSVAENLRFVLRATGWTDSRAIKARVTEVLMQVGLAGRESERPYILSGGEQQRVAIARALLNDPPLILMDEPTGNLDPVVTDEIMNLIHRLNRQGAGILMATHEYGLLERFPARVLHLADGVVHEGLPQLP